MPSFNALNSSLTFTDIFAHTYFGRLHAKASPHKEARTFATQAPSLKERKSVQAIAGIQDKKTQQERYKMRIIALSFA